MKKIRITMKWKSTGDTLAQTDLTFSDDAYEPDGSVRAITMKTILDIQEEIFLEYIEFGIQEIETE